MSQPLFLENMILTSVLTRDTHWGQHRGEGRVKVEDWNDAVTSQEIAQSHQKQEKTRKDPALEPQEGARSYGYLDLELLASRSIRE